MSKLMFPKLDGGVLCTNPSCKTPKGVLFSEQAHAYLRMENDQIIVDPLCPTCAALATRFGISVPLIRSLIAAEEKRADGAEFEQVEREDLKKQMDDVFGLFDQEEALFLCEIGCGCAMKPPQPQKADKMKALIRKTDGREEIITICALDGGLATRAGLAVEDFVTVVRRKSEEAREALVQEQQARRVEARAKYFADLKANGGLQRTLATERPAPTPQPGLTQARVVEVSGNRK